MTVVPPVLGIHQFLLGQDASLAREVERHRERTMTVVSLMGTESITRCGTCPREESRPCKALRVLALPFAHRPGYRPEWQLTPATVDGALDGPARRDEEDRAVGTDGLVPPPYPRIADMPPPGSARRRLLREFGIGIRDSDYTDEELRLRETTRRP